MLDVVGDRHHLMYGDCLERIGDITPNSVDLTVTSPPYYNAREYAQYESYDAYLTFLDDVFSKVYDVTKDGRFCAVNLSVVIEPRANRRSESVRYPIPFHFVSNMTKMGWKFIEDIVWMKPDGSVPNRNGGFYQHRKPLAYKPNVVTEYIFIFQKPCDFLIDKMIKNVGLDSLVGDGYERTNVWEINPENKMSKYHSAPFPLKLASNLIEYYSMVGDLVLDPFMGSNTTGLAAHNHDRQYIGIERDESYFKVSCDRLVNAEKKLCKLF